MPDEDDDLSETLQFVAAGRRPAARARIANSSDTRAFLDTGLELLRQDLFDHTGPDDENSPRPSVLFRSLSRPRLIEAGNRLRVSGRLPPGTMTTDGQFRDRWRYADEFAEDLVSYLFRFYPYAQQMKMVRASIESGPLKDASLATLIESLSAAEIDRSTADTASTLRTLVQWALPNHPRVRELAVATYRDQRIPAWAGVYEFIGSRYGLFLKAEYSWIDVAELLNTMVEGASLRAVLDKNLVTLASGGNVLSTSIRLMLPALLEDGTSNMSFESMYPIRS